VARHDRHDGANVRRAIGHSTQRRVAHAGARLTRKHRERLASFDLRLPPLAQRLASLQGEAGSCPTKNRSIVVPS
jgi:hypothetical protein